MKWAIIDTEYSTYKDRNFPVEDNLKELLEVAYVKLYGTRITSCYSFLIKDMVPDVNIHHITSECISADSVGIDPHQAGQYLKCMLSDYTVYVNGLRYDRNALILDETETPNWKEAKDMFSYNHLSDFEFRHGIASPPDYLNHTAIYCCIRLARCIIEQWRYDDILKRGVKLDFAVQAHTQQPHIPAWTGYVIR